MFPDQGVCVVWALSCVCSWTWTRARVVESAHPTPHMPAHASHPGVARADIAVRGTLAPPLQIRNALAGDTKASAASIWARMGAGLLSGCIGILVANPTDVVKVGVGMRVGEHLPLSASVDVLVNGKHGAGDVVLLSRTPLPFLSLLSATPTPCPCRFGFKLSCAARVPRGTRAPSTLTGQS